MHKLECLDRSLGKEIEYITLSSACYLHSHDLKLFWRILSLLTVSQLLVIIMEGFFGKLPPPEEPETYEFGCSGVGGENENSMLDWEWQASARYGGQSANLRNWLRGISRDPRQPRITMWTGGGTVCIACNNFDVKVAVH